MNSGSKNGLAPCSYCGRENWPSAIHCSGCGTELLSSDSEAPPEAPPALPVARLVTADELDAAFFMEDGFHHADWDVIRHWIDSNVSPPEKEAAWNEAALLWLTKLRGDLGGDYIILQSSQTVLLCDLPLETARRLLDYADRVALNLKNYLGEMAGSEAFGKDVVIVFTDQGDYYQYISHHSPDGEQSASSGVCVHSGYMHIALFWCDELDAANTIVHELSHHCLAHLPLPLWLNEGVALTLQRAIAFPARTAGEIEQEALFAAAINWQAPLMWEELAERHFSFWTEESIQSFWAGTSFHEPGDASELSYSLAEVLLKIFTEEIDQAGFPSFLRAASAEDAGQAAAMEVLGVDLGAIAAAFLGEGNWRPRKTAVAACWNAAGWNRYRTKPTPWGGG